MKKLILIILFAATTISIPPQTTISSTPVDTTFDKKVEILVNDINTDLTKAAEEKEALEKKIEMNKLMVAEKNRRIDYILRKMSQKKPQTSKETVKTVVKTVPAKQRYEIKKDSACIRKELFSSKCNKWDTYYILIDSKEKDTLVLKRN